MTAESTRRHDIPLGTGGVLRVEPVTASVFRIRLSTDASFCEPGLVRYGVVRTEWPEVRCAVRRTARSVRLTTAAATLIVDRRDGRVSLLDAAGHLLTGNRTAPRAGFDVDFALAPGERLYGLGDETRDRVQKRGHAGMMVLRNVASYAPIPFLMSTAGWAVFLNTTWFHRFDAGAAEPDRLRFWGQGGSLDYYLIAGRDLPELLDRYTQITGRPHLLPLWAYGLTFVCDEREVRARDVLYEAYEFRRSDIPCDLIGLEPDWMDRHYDFSVDKKWSTQRFHVPEWLPHRSPGGFTAALRNMGFHLSLWLCCDYDVSDHEEQQLGARPGAEPGAAPDRTAEDIIRDPHFHPHRFDTITRPGQPWFEHLKKFVDDGADAFKMDGSNQVCFHPDRKWANGMTDEEMHNLYPVLLGKQMSLGFREHTGRRAMIYTAGGYAGIQRYAATWAGDTGGGDKPLVSILNHGLSGHSNASCDMQVWNPEGVHFGFFQPWCQVLSWHQYNQPWFLGDRMAAIFRFYAKLRYRLLPYFYSAAHQAARTGLPVMRAMPLVAPDDPRADELIRQYMVGDAFLTAAFTPTIHLPAGRWFDYWTGDAYDGPCDLPCTYPRDRGGVLFVRGGAIIPMYPDMQYVGQVPLDSLALDVYPHGSSTFTLREDDGTTYAYLDGRVAETVVRCRATAKRVELTIGPRTGSYDGMPEARRYTVRLHVPRAPTRVTVDGRARPRRAGPDGWTCDAATKTIELTAAEAPARAAAVRIACTWS